MSAASSRSMTLRWYLAWRAGSAFLTSAEVLTIKLPAGMSKPFRLILVFVLQTSALASLRRAKAIGYETLLCEPRTTKLPPPWPAGTAG